MDWLFELQIPRSSHNVLVIGPLGKTFITGVSSVYRADQYDAQILGRNMSEDEFKTLMKEMNGTLNRYWPCNSCIWFGYLLSPFSLGLSFLIPNMCISDAKLGLIAAIERQNRLKLREKGLRLLYKQGFSMSWLELEVVVPCKGEEKT